MNTQTRMKAGKRDMAKGAESKKDREDKIEAKKRMSTGSVPNVSKAEKKRVREAKLRELLEMDEGVVPSFTEIEYANAVITAEMEFAGASQKMKKIAEENLDVACVTLAEEIQKREDADQEEKNEVIEVSSGDEDGLSYDDSDKSGEDVVVSEEDSDENLVPLRSKAKKKAFTWDESSDDEVDDDECGVTESGNENSEELEAATKKEEGVWLTVDMTNRKKKKSKVPKNGKAETGKKAPTVKEPEATTKSKPPPVTPPRSKGAKPIIKDNNGDKAKNKGTMKDALMGESLAGTKANGKYNHRLRVTMVAKQEDALELTLYQEKQRLLTEFCKIMGIVEPKARVVTWGGTGETDNVAENLERLSPYAAEKYVGMPNSKSTLGSGKNKIGIRVNTNLTLDQFVDSWGKYRREQGWVYVAPAEMQQSPTAFAVGACQGSSPQMLTKAINDKLKEELGVEVGVEVSFQLIDNDDMGSVVNEFWKTANTKAENETPSGVSKSKTKSLYCPAALKVYVSELKYKKQVKRLMMQKFGSGKTKKDWATWPDGSMMRFIPFLPPTSSERNLEKVKSMMTFQIISKAHETVRDLKVIDLFTPQEYLRGQTLQQAILSLKSKKLKGMHVFKHVIKKWTWEPLTTEYQISSYSTLTEEADAIVEGLMDILHNEYSDKVMRHFTGSSILESNHYNPRRQVAEEVDLEIEKMLDETDEGNDEILEPGYLVIVERGEIEQGESTVQMSKDDSKAPSKKDDLESVRDGSESGKISKLTDVEYDISDEDTAFTGNLTGGSIETARDKNKEWKEAKAVMRKLKRLKMSREEFDEWKKENPEKVYLSRIMSKSRKRKNTNHLADLGLIKMIEDENPPKQLKESLGQLESVRKDP